MPVGREMLANASVNWKALLFVAEEIKKAPLCKGSCQRSWLRDCKKSTEKTSFYENRQSQSLRHFLAKTPPPFAQGRRSKEVIKYFHNANLWFAIHAPLGAIHSSRSAIAREFTEYKWIESFCFRELPVGREMLANASVNWIALQFVAEEIWKRLPLHKGGKVRKL